MTKPKEKPTVVIESDKKAESDWWFQFVPALLAVLAFIGMFPTVRWIVGTAKHIHAVWSAPARIDEMGSDITQRQWDQKVGDHKQDKRLDALEQRVKALEEKSKEGQSTIWWYSTNIVMTNYSMPWTIMPNNSTLENITVIPYDN